MSKHEDRKSDAEVLARDVRRLRNAVLGAPGELPSEVRRAAFAGASVPPALAAYTHKVRAHAYKVVDRDIDDMRADGFSEDQVLELTLAIAVGEGWRRIEAGLLALDGATLEGERA